jgi:hypothetical protein
LWWLSWCAFCINYGLLLFFAWGVVTAPMARFCINYGLLLSFAWGVVAALRYPLLHASLRFVAAITARFCTNYGLLLSFAWGVVAALMLPAAATDHVSMAKFSEN